MDLGKITRDAEDRSAAWGAAVTAFLGVGALLGAGAWYLDGAGPGSAICLLLAFLYFALAYSVLRGSRAAAVTAVGLYVLQSAFSFLALGFAGMGPLWTLILGALLWGGMRGVFAQAARAPRADAPRRPLA